MSPSRRRRAGRSWEGRQIITVATLPGRGVYARHLGHPEGVDGVHRITVPTVPTSVTSANSVSPASFDRAWLTRNVDRVDVVHVLGLPRGATPDEVTAAADLVQGAGKPLVLTVYHLSDPTGGDGAHVDRLGALVTRADAVLTLTATAADEITDRWGVRPLVLPHPHAVDFVRMRTPRPRWRRGEFLVGTHLASLNGPCDPVALVDALTAACREVEDARLLVNLHASVLDPCSSAYAPTVFQRVARTVRAAGGTVRVHRPFAESELWDHLFGLDVSVVPGIRGSHSVWPEACHDLGTQIVLPSASHAAAQRPCLTYDLDGGSPDPASLTGTLLTARERGSLLRADPTDRWRERVAIAESLRSLYEQLRETAPARIAQPAAPAAGVSGGSRSRARSSPGEEWVSAPTER